jgi:hypothetical protein
VAEEQLFGAQPVSTAAGRVIASPFQFVLTGEDNLRVISLNSLAGVRVKIQGRRLNDRGKVDAFAFDHVPNSDRSARSEDYALGVGAILNLVVFAYAGTPVVGQTFVITQLIRGFGASAVVLGTLLQGYVTSVQELAWPGSPLVSSTDGEPYVRNIVGTAPGVGNEIDETVPSGARWELVSFYAYCNKNANGGPLELRKVSAGGNIFIAIIANHSHNVGAVINYYFAQGFNLVMAGPPATGSSMQGLPFNHLFAAGDHIRTSLVNNAGDQWSAPYYTVREWLEAP